MVPLINHIGGCHRADLLYLSPFRPVTYGWVGGGGGHDWGSTEYHGTGSQYQEQYTEHPQQHQEYGSHEQTYGAQEQEYGGDDMYSE